MYYDAKKQINYMIGNDSDQRIKVGTIWQHGHWSVIKPIEVLRASVHIDNFSTIKD